MLVRMDVSQTTLMQIIIYYWWLSSRILKLDFHTVAVNEWTTCIISTRRDGNIQVSVLSNNHGQNSLEIFLSTFTYSSLYELYELFQSDRAIWPRRFVSLTLDGSRCLIILFWGRNDNILGHDLTFLCMWFCMCYKRFFHGTFVKICQHFNVFLVSSSDRGMLNQLSLFKLNHHSPFFSYYSYLTKCNE